MDNVTPLWGEVPPEDPVSLNDFTRADIYTVPQAAARLGISAGRDCLKNGVTGRHAELCLAGRISCDRDDRAHGGSD
jgi:hypothetical protein